MKTDKTIPEPPDKAMNICKLIEEFNSEEKCREYLEGLRWPHGVECPRCKSTDFGSVKERDQFNCNVCQYQFSVTSNTIFHDSHLPLWKWFLTTYMMLEAKKGVSALQLKRTLSVSYKTAWYLCHRIRAALKDDAPHRTVNHSRDEWVNGNVHTNTVESIWSLLKRSIIGSYHKVSVKHLDAYLDELEFRYNNRNNDWAFRDALLKLVSASKLTYEQLTQINGKEKTSNAPKNAPRNQKTLSQRGHRARQARGEERQVR